MSQFRDVGVLPRRLADHAASVTFYLYAALSGCKVEHRSLECRIVDRTRYGASIGRGDARSGDLYALLRISQPHSRKSNANNNANTLGTRNITQNSNSHSHKIYSMKVKLKLQNKPGQSIPKRSILDPPGPFHLAPPLRSVFPPRC